MYAAPSPAAAEIPVQVNGLATAASNDAAHMVNEARQALREKGYRVFSARDSQDALSLCARLKERIELGS